MCFLWNRNSTLFKKKRNLAQLQNEKMFFFCCLYLIGKKLSILQSNSWLNKEKKLYYCSNLLLQIAGGDFLLKKKMVGI